MATVSPTKLAKCASCLANCEQLGHGCNLSAVSEMSFVYKHFCPSYESGVSSEQENALSYVQGMERVFIFGFQLCLQKQTKKRLCLHNFTKWDYMV